MSSDPNLSISSATSSNMTDNVSDVEIYAQNTDVAGEQEETEYINSEWSDQLGIYKSIPEVKTAIDMRAIWTIGKGWKADDPKTRVLLNHIRGFGRDTFNSILKNMIVCARIGGDAFAEIILDEDDDLFNLKPKDPGSMKIIVNRKGEIIRYEQISKTGKKKTKIAEWKPSEIFHLTNKRVADEMHGTGDIESLQGIVEAANESFSDMRKLMHRHVKPIMCFKLATDDTTKISAFVTKMDAVVNKGENIYIPQDTVEFELISVPANATLNPLPWREHLKNYFYQVVGIPQIILGGASDTFTEATAKVAYLAFQQSVEDEQQTIEDAVKRQLFMEIDLEFPASMENELISDQNKDQETTSLMQPSDTTAFAGA